MKNSVKHFTKLYSTLIVVGSFANTPIANAANFGDQLHEALAGGKVDLDLQLRLETAEQDNALSDSSLLTLRSRLGYETGKLAGFGAYLQIEDTTAVGSDDNFSSPGPNSPGPGHSVIADPEFTELNQGYLSYSGFSDTVLKYGRQRIKLDNARFIGNVIWRQNEQTYDGFSISNQSIDELTVFYSFTTNANNVVGANIDVDINSLNVSYNGFTAGKLTGYAYLYDFEDADADDSNTFGVRFAGGTPISDSVKILYTGEFARQSDSGDNPNSFDVDYLLAEGGVKFGPGVTLQAGFESLGSDNGEFSFFTPFSTLHAFNGWADVFLVGSGTAAGLQNGLDDFYLKAGGKAGTVDLLAVYHDFSSDTGGIDYGTELNLQATFAVGKFDFGIKYADYSADDAVTPATAAGLANVDTERFWLWVSTHI